MRELHGLGRVMGAEPLELRIVLGEARRLKEWTSITRNMLGRGPQPPAGQQEAILGYLTSNFGKESGY